MTTRLAACVLLLASACGFEPEQCERDYKRCNKVCGEGELAVCNKALAIAEGVCRGERTHPAFQGRTGKALACARVTALRERIAVMKAR